MGRSPQRKLEEAWQSPARPSAQVWGTRMFTLCSSDPQLQSEFFLTDSTLYCGQDGIGNLLEKAL